MLHHVAPHVYTAALKIYIFFAQRDQLARAKPAIAVGEHERPVLPRVVGHGLQLGRGEVAALLGRLTPGQAFNVGGRVSGYAAVSHGLVKNARQHPIGAVNNRR